jgi:hypothetical protein
MSTAAHAEPPPRPPRSYALLVVAYAVVTVVMTWPYVNYGSFASASYDGDQQLIVWTLAWDNHAVLHGLPLFGANVFFPAADALRYNEHLFGVSLFTLPWTALGASPVLAHNLTWWLAFLFNGLASYALLRRLVHSGPAAFLGSLAFVYPFYVMLHAHAHLHLIWLWPLPLSILLLERWFDDPFRRRRVVLWLAVLLVGLLTSWYVAAMMIMVNAAALLVLLLTPRRTVSDLPPASRVWRERLLQLGAAGLVTLLCLYPFARHYVGLRSSPGEAALYSANVASYLVPPENTLVGRWWRAHVDARPGSIFGEQTVFAGWLALVLAAIGLAVLARSREIDRRAWLFPLLAAGAFLLSLGPTPGFPGAPLLAPFNWLAALPGGEGMRAPARFSAVAMLGVAGLVAIAMDAMLRRFPDRRHVVMLVAVPLMLSEYFVVDFPAGHPVPHPVPGIYLTPEVQSARSLVSLPEYQGTERWFLGGNYLYYSTAHWRPIVNGFGRAEPEGHEAVVASLQTFPAGASLLRSLGVQYVVLHADRFPDHGRDVLSATRRSPDYRLVRTVGPDYLFEVVSRP